MAKEMERKNLERKLERIADDRAERMSDTNPDLPPLPGSGSAPENRPVYRPCPSPVAEFQNACPAQARRSQTRLAAFASAGRCPPNASYAEAGR